MALHTYQVRLRSDTNLPRDDVVNVLHFRHNGVPGQAPANHQQMATDLAAVYNTNLGTVLGGVNQITVTAYDTEGPPPHFPLASVVVAALGLDNPPGPREVALVLSYYGERNIARQRGRCYIGPIRQSILAERPPAAAQTTLLNVAAALAGLGGIDWDWVVYSPTAQDDIPVSDAWVDNDWDTQRRRSSKSTARATRHVGA